MATVTLDQLVVDLIFKGSTKDLNKFEQGVKNLNKRIDGLARNFTLAGGALSAALFAVGGTILNFEKAMNNLQAVLNPTAEDMALLRDQAKEMGRTTAFSASQAAAAQTELAQAGFKVKEILTAMPHVLRLAAAGQLDMGEAATLVVNQLNAYGLGASEAQRVTDVLAKTASSASTKVKELGPAFRQVAPLTNELNISIEQTGAMLAQLRDRGQTAEQAGTGLRAVFARLLNPVGETQEGIEELGLSVDSIATLARQGKIDQIFRQFNESGITAGTSMKIFGQEAGIAGTILAGTTAETAALTMELKTAEGTAGRMERTQMQGLPGAIAEFKSALEGLQIELGESGLTGWIERAANALKGFIAWLSKADGWVKTTIAAVLASGPVLLGLAVVLKLVTFALSGLVPLLKLARGAASLWRNALILTRIQMGLLSVQTWWANSALRGFATSMLKFARAPVAGMVAGLRAVGLAMWGLVANPVGAAIAAVALALVAAAVIIRKYWEPIKAFFIGMGEGLQEALQPIKEAFGEVIVALEPLRPVLSAIGDAFGWVGDIIGKVVGWFTKLLDPVDETSRSVKQAGDAGRTTGKIIGTLLLLPIKLIIGYFKLWIMIIRTLINVFTWLRDTVGKVISTIRGLPVLIAQEWDQIVGIVGGIWSRVNDTVRGWIQAIIDFVRKLPGRVVGILKDIPGMVADAIRDIPGLGAALEAFTGIAGKVGKR